MIVDHGMRPLPVDFLREVLITGEDMELRYLNRPEETESRFFFTLIAPFGQRAPLR